MPTLSFLKLATKMQMFNRANDCSMVSFVIGFFLALTGCVRAATVEIVRDHYGMPHIFSISEAAGMYVFGQAQAEDRLTALLRNYKQARGELSEIDGPSALSADIQVRAFRL